MFHRKDLPTPTTHPSSPSPKVFHPKTVSPPTPSASSQPISSSHQLKTNPSTPRALPKSITLDKSTFGTSSPATMATTPHRPCSRKRGGNCLKRHLTRRFRPRHRKAHAAQRRRNLLCSTLPSAYRLIRMVITALVLSTLSNGAQVQQRVARSLSRRCSRRIRMPRPVLHGHRGVDADGEDQMDGRESGLQHCRLGKGVAIWATILYDRNPSPLYHPSQPRIPTRSENNNPPPPAPALSTTLACYPSSTPRPSRQPGELLPRRRLIAPGETRGGTAGFLPWLFARPLPPCCSPTAITRPP